MPVPQSLAGPEQRHAFVAWLNQCVNNSSLSKSVLAGELGHDTTQQLNKFLRGLALPMPTTLKRLCRKMGVSWPAAFAHAGYYGELLHVLADLARLSSAWRNEDKVYPDAAAQFRSTGVLRIDEMLVGDALKTPRFRPRYHIGCYQDLPHEVIVDDTIPAEIAKVARHEAANPRPWCCVVPKPLAIAIFVATAGFPRRGDIYRDGADAYAAHVLENSVSIIDAAVAHRPKRVGLPRLLKSAHELLKDKALSFETRRVMVAELMEEWADSLCGPYTHYARVASFAWWGEAGTSESTVTPWTQTPQRRTAALPDIEELTDVKLIA